MVWPKPSSERYKCNVDASFSNIHNFVANTHDSPFLNTKFDGFTFSISNGFTFSISKSKTLNLIISKKEHHFILYSSNFTSPILMIHMSATPN